MESESNRDEGSGFLKEMPLRRLFRDDRSGTCDDVERALTVTVHASDRSETAPGPTSGTACRPQCLQRHRERTPDGKAGVGGHGR